MGTAREYRKGTETFRPRARLVSVLGEQLIRDATVGLLELVKNGYDADADHVTVKLLNLKFDPKEKSEAEALKEVTIMVEDDGEGMDLDTILHKWLEPATGHKEEAKKRNERTQKGRLPLGEKGVGRFAAHKLGRQLTLISRARNEQGMLNDAEVVVEINWDDFDDPEAYLNKVPVEYEEREPEYFLHHSGTLMIMEHARAVWKKTDVERVSRTLLRLMSPFKTPKSFKVTLVCPDYPQYEDLDPGELLDTAHARLDVIVDDEGFASYEYLFHLEPYPQRKVERERIDLKPGIEEWQPVDRKPECGGFFATFHIWDRDPTNLQLSRTNIQDLNQFNGVSVFRDGIRAMPYGEPEDDWLALDKARYMKTSSALSRRNVVGMVEINQAVNDKLRDKSNREGFIENLAFQDFQNLMLGVANIAHKEFSEDRRNIRAHQAAERKELIPAVEQLESGVANISNKIEEIRQLAKSFVKEGKITPDIAEEFTQTLQQASQALQGAVEDTRQAAADTLTTFDEKQETLLALAGFGLAAERFTHEFARLTREATLMLHQIAGSADIRGFSQVKEKVDALGSMLDALHDLVVALGPMFYIRRRTSENAYNVKTMVEHALLLNRGPIKINKIRVEVNQPDGPLFVRMRRSSLIQVFNNLIDNSCYWLSRKSEEDNRHLRVTILAEEAAVIVADDGPGIHPRDNHRIFDAFFSNKVNGRGLGLFIAREALAEAQSTIELIQNSEHPATFRVGASFRIQFSHERKSEG